ncbi:MAG: hypothetical protein NZ821_09945, partial [Gloeomargarita sp. SKYB31]|nr:hypothetical protein [Gloeomargarita sp. SKYB31]
IADSIIIWFDTYSNMIFAIGKGPSTTTITATPKAITMGETTVIEGTVLDNSPGTKDSKIALRFPKGVPVVADECVGNWMLYVYKQFPKPSEVTGVWVKLDAVNLYTGECIEIGGTHTDETGMFTVAWQPPKEGLWKIIATFPGSNSYYPSCAQTSITVTPAPAPAPTPASPEQVQEVRSVIDALQPLVTSLIVIVVICICLVAYDIYVNRKMLKQFTK